MHTHLVIVFDTVVYTGVYTGTSATATFLDSLFLVLLFFLHLQ